MLHWSPTLIDFSDTEDCDSRGKSESSECVIFDQPLSIGWMDEKRRQALYIPSLQSDQEIFDYALEDLAMPSVSFSEEQEFEKTVHPKDHNSNILFKSEPANMDFGILESKNIVISASVSTIDQRHGKGDAQIENKQLKCDSFPCKDGHNVFPQQKSEASSPASCDDVLVLGSVSSSTVDSSSAPAGISAYSLDGNGDRYQLSTSPTDHFSNKENVDVVEITSESEGAYDMQNLRDSLPKLKVMTPANLHNEISGAFMSYSDMEASKSTWLVPCCDDSLDSVGPATGESEHDTSFCSVDSTMTVSSVESLPKLFYDPDLHHGHHLTAVSVPPLRRGLKSAAVDCDRNVASSKASYSRDGPQLSESKTKSRSCFRNSTTGFNATSRLKTPDPNSSCATSFSTSSKSRFARRPEPTLSKAMVKLVFPSPTKSSSSLLNGFAVGSQRTDGFMELYSQTYGKRIRNLRTTPTVEDCVDSKRRCQRSMTPQIGNVKLECHSEPKDTLAVRYELSGRLGCPVSATVPRKHTSSVPRDHRLGISGPTPLRSRISVRSSESASAHCFASNSRQYRSLFPHEPKRHALVSHDISQNGHDTDSTGSGDLELGCRAKKRPHLSPGKVVNKRALMLSPPLVKRDPLLEKFFDNIPVVTAANVMRYSDDQLEAVTMKNTLLNRDQCNKPSTSNVTTQQMATARPPSRLKWRADLVTMVTEGSKVPTTTATAKKSILNVRSYVMETSVA